MAQFWRVSYTWRLREVMAANGMYATSDIIPHLTEHGITMSTSQAHRLVTGTPDRLNLTVLAALCHILGVTTDELIDTSAHLVGVKRRAVGDTERHPRRSRNGPVIRPVRAEITPAPGADDQ
jgi:DNA-binding Xre family transcriptional regulator